MPKHANIKSNGKLVKISNVHAMQLILANYAPKRNKTLNIEIEGKDDISQTYLPQDDIDIPISDLLNDKSKRALYFLDSRKVEKKYWGIMIDYTQSGPLPIATNKDCWWCRHPFKSMPIGCPLVYNPHKHSGVEKERFDEKMSLAGYPQDTNDFFQTEGIFCSFPCCKAYILSQKNCVKYKESLTLLSLLYTILTTKNADFPTAGHWKLLKSAGGHLDINQFRQTFGKIEYCFTTNVRRPYMFCSSEYISEKKIKIFKEVRE